MITATAIAAKKKILLIEDDPQVRESTAEILGLAHYNVKTAPNGREGIKMAKKEGADLILCDIMMPEIDGYGVLHMLERDPKTASIPFIFLTAKDKRSEMRKGMELGADDYLAKPFEEIELLNAIEGRLKKFDVIKKEFSKDLRGLNQFLDNVRGLKELATLSQQRPIVHYKKKEVIFHEGDSANFLYFLNKGKVKTYRVHEDGKEYVTSLHKSGDFFGYLALFENKPYFDSAEVLEDSEICKMPKDDFLSLVYKNNDVANQFIKMLSDNISEREKQLLSLAYDTVRKRVAEALLLLEQKYQNVANGSKKTRINLAREDLAALAGTATESVIRCLSEFKSEKLIHIEGRDIVLLNSESLKNINA